MTEEIEKQKILELLEHSKDYHTALLTTFNFEVDFFERAVFSRLIQNGIRRISLFVDAGELTKAISASDSYILGQKYSVNPITIHGSFHPKVILLLGDRKARVIVGSANLKLSSYYVNSEVYNWIDYDSEHPEYRDVVFGTINFFQNLYADTSLSYQLDDGVMDRLKTLVYNRQAPNNNRVWFFHNLEQDILSQAVSCIDEKVNKIYVAVPYYDKNVMALQKIMDVYPDAACYLLLQQGKSTFPVDHTDILPQENIIVFDLLKEPDRNDHFYHGKVFLFITDFQAFFLYGSSNCTQSALTSTNVFK